MSNNSTCKCSNGTDLCDFLDAINHKISDSKCPQGDKCSNIYIDVATALEHLKQYHNTPSVTQSKQYKNRKPVPPKLPAENRLQDRDQLSHFHRRRPAPPPTYNHNNLENTRQQLVQKELTTQIKNLNIAAPPTLPSNIPQTTPCAVSEPPNSDAQIIQMLTDQLARLSKENTRLNNESTRLNNENTRLNNENTRLREINAKGTVCTKYHPKIVGKNKNDNRPSKEEMEAKHANSDPSGCIHSEKVAKVYCEGNDMFSVMGCGTKSLVNGSRYCEKHYKPPQNFQVNLLDTNPQSPSQSNPSEIPVIQLLPNEVAPEQPISFADE